MRAWGTTRPSRSPVSCRGYHSTSYVTSAKAPAKRLMEADLQPARMSVKERQRFSRRFTLSHVFARVRGCSMQQVKILLDESDIPENWYNVVADMPNPPAPPLGPDSKPIGPSALAAIFPGPTIEQEVSRERWILIPAP